MENLTIYDLTKGLDVNVKPIIYEDKFYFHVKVKNAPYFMMCQYNDDKDYDKKTLLSVSSYNHIDEKTAKDFEKFFNSLMPKFVGWDNTRVHHDTIKYDDNGILRVDFDLIWCEMDK